MPPTTAAPSGESAIDAAVALTHKLLAEIADASGTADDLTISDMRAGTKARPTPALQTAARLAEVLAELQRDGVVGRAVQELGTGARAAVTKSASLPRSVQYRQLLRAVSPQCAGAIRTKISKSAVALQRLGYGAAAAESWATGALLSEVTDRIAGWAGPAPSRPEGRRGRPHRQAAGDESSHHAAIAGVSQLTS
jgi:hypothetical protein